MHHHSDKLSRALNRLSILVTVFKCNDLLIRCLDSLREACGGLSFELIVVDNAAQKSTKALAHTYKAKYHAMPTDVGFAGANNVGFNLATREFVILINSDTVFHEEPFTSMVEFFDSHENAQIAQGTVLQENRQSPFHGMLDYSGMFMTPYGILESTDYGKCHKDPSVSSPKKVYYAFGALLMLRRHWVRDTLGFLFHQHFYAYYEETDLCHRTWLSGGEVWQIPTPPVNHAHSATFTRHFNPYKVKAQALYNARFSYLTCFSAKSLLTIMPFYECTGLLLSISHFCKTKDHSDLRGILSSYRKLLFTLPLIWETRQKVQAQRKLTDAMIFDIIMKPRTWREWFHRHFQRNTSSCQVSAKG